jgi:NAD(P)-dependent dehydrogenase (short-subunit alcohol dehydrogenase family)
MPRDDGVRSGRADPDRGRHVIDGEFAGRVILVTGGCGGLGRACGTWFAERGGTVVLGDLDAAALARTAAEIGAADGTVIDVGDEHSVERSVEETVSAHGPITILVNAAGIVGSGSVETMEVAAWRHVVDVNLTGTFLVSRSVIAGMRAAGRGKIVNFSSVNARTGGNTLSGAAYAASKAGIEALTRHLAIALAPAIQVNAVAPGPVATPMLDRLSDAELDALVSAIPARRTATGEEVAALVGFLSSTDADYITGATVPQNGGIWLG